MENVMDFKREMEYWKVRTEAKENERAFWEKMAERECRYKNEAYLFILSNGLLDRFVEFCKEFQDDDAHRKAVQFLEETLL